MSLPLPPPAHLAPLPAPVRGAGGVRVLAGVPYAALPGVRPLELDLYLPESARPAPAVMFLHGGGWRLGSRHSAGPAFAGRSPSPFELLAQDGLAVASVDYRLSGEATWPAQLHDAKAAVRWLRARSGELGLAPDRIAAWGESAGGHLAALLGMTAGRLEGAVGIGTGSSAVCAVAAWYPPTDLAAIAPALGADPMDPGSREAQLLGAALPTAPNRCAEASPVTHAAAAPPFLLLHGRADRFVPCEQSARLHDALRVAGTPVDLHTYDGADHMWLGTPEVALDALERTRRFLALQLLS